MRSRRNTMPYFNISDDTQWSTFADLVLAPREPAVSSEAVQMGWVVSDLYVQ